MKNIVKKEHWWTYFWFG